jgi:hypothetical protein
LTRSPGSAACGEIWATAADVIFEGLAGARLGCVREGLPEAPRSTPIPTPRAAARTPAGTRRDRPRERVLVGISVALEVIVSRTA